MAKRWFSIILILALLLTGCAKDPADPTEPSNRETLPAQTQAAGQEAGELLLLFTGGSQCTGLPAEASETDWAALAAWKAQGENTLLLGGGDTLSEDQLGLPEEGDYAAALMNAAGFDFAVPGEHDFDGGVEALLRASRQAKFSFLACNWIDLTTGEPVFSPYAIRSFGEYQVAFIGVCAPQTQDKAIFADFTDGKGSPRYSFCAEDDGQALYDRVQSAIDQAKTEGADYVICIGHTGLDLDSMPWTSAEIIANTTGMLVYLDGNSVSAPGVERVKDKDGNTVYLCAPAPGETAALRVDLSRKTVERESAPDALTPDPEVESQVGRIQDDLEKWKNRSAGRSGRDLPLDTDEPSDLGRFCAEAYRSVLGTNIALVLGSDLTGEIRKGTVTHRDLLSLLPAEDCACVVEITGQQLLDLLEMAAMGGETPCLNGAGLTYDVDETIPSGVLLDGNGDFVEVQGPRRVSNVRVNGTPLARASKYTLAGSCGLLLYGDGGYTMLDGCPVLQNNGVRNQQILLFYFQKTQNGMLQAE